MRVDLPLDRKTVENQDCATGPPGRGLPGRRTSGPWAAGRWAVAGRRAAARWAVGLLLAKPGGK